MPNFAVQRLEFLPSNIRRIASISQDGMREVERINKQQIDRMIEKARRASWRGRLCSMDATCSKGGAEVTRLRV